MIVGVLYNISALLNYSFAPVSRINNASRSLLMLSNRHFTNMYNEIVTEQSGLIDF